MQPPSLWQGEVMFVTQEQRHWHHLERGFKKNTEVLTREVVSTSRLHFTRAQVLTSNSMRRTHVFCGLYLWRSFMTCRLLQGVTHKSATEKVKIQAMNLHSSSLGHPNYFNLDSFARFISFASSFSIFPHEKSTGDSCGPSLDRATLGADTGSAATGPRPGT